MKKRTHLQCLGFTHHPHTGIETFTKNWYDDGSIDYTCTFVHHVDQSILQSIQNDYPLIQYPLEFSVKLNIEEV